jgi:hypothetical protein
VRLRSFTREQNLDAFASHFRDCDEGLASTSRGGALPEARDEASGRSAACTIALMALWNVSVRLGAEIAGAESDCVRSKLGPYALMPEAGYGTPPEYRARGLLPLRLEASSVEEAGTVALARVRAAGVDCDVELEPEVRSVSPSLSASTGGPARHRPPRAAAVKDPGSLAVAEAIRKRRRKRK